MDPLTKEKTAEFLNRYIHSSWRLTRLAGDASTRAYYRVTGEGKSFILCHDTALAGSEMAGYPFFIMHEILTRHNVPVPCLVDVDASSGLILQEDLGDMLLEDYSVTASPKEVQHLYRACSDMMVAVQSIRGEGAVPFGLFFDREKLNFEFDFFIEHTLAGFFGAGGSKGIADLRALFDAVAVDCDRPEHFVLNHRDYHSRNIMLRRGRPVLIDFQDARMGLPHYDLVSLLLDPYNILADELIDEMKEYYRTAAAKAGVCIMERDEFDYFYDVMAFQRLIKAAGSYGYLATAGKKPAFARYIIPTLRRIDTFAENQAVTAGPWRPVREIIRSEGDDIFS